MRKYIGIALFSMVAALFVATPAAHAQSIGGHVRVGGHDRYDHRGGHGGVSVDIFIGGGRGIYGPRYPYPRGPVYRGGCYDGYDCGRPVYRDPGCYNGCGDYGYGNRGGYGYYDPRPSSIQVQVWENVVVGYDRWGNPCFERRLVWVTAHLDRRNGGYWYGGRRVD